MNWFLNFNKNITLAPSTESSVESKIPDSVLSVLSGVQLTTVGQILSYLLVSSLDGSTSTQPVDSNIYKVENKIKIVSSYYCMEISTHFKI